MAAATGGLALSASNAGELGTAIGKAVEGLAREDAATASATARAAEGGAKPAWNLEGSARLAEKRRSARRQGFSDLGFQQADAQPVSILNISQPRPRAASRPN